MKIRKILKTTSALLSILALLAAALVILKRPRTPIIKNASGKPMAGSIASLEKISLGGHPQWILIRGENRSSPILLFLHGGPGMPMMYLAHTFQRHLEDSFVCVQWDQRGAGKSYNKNMSTSSLTVEQILSDAVELIRELQRRFQKKRIFLAGHSWGSYLGMLLIHRYPELFHGYIGIGQVADDARAREITARFLRQKALDTGDQEALLELDTSGLDVHEKWLFKYGGALFGKTGYTPFILAGIKAPEYGLFDIPKVGKGSSFSSRNMRYDAIDTPLMDHVTEVRVPVYFFTGRHDFTTPYELVEEYFRKLQAPLKKMIWFERSAHFPFFSEPELFARALKTVLQDAARDNSP